jgi:hypothetical protein
MVLDGSRVAEEWPEDGRARWRLARAHSLLDGLEYFGRQACHVAAASQATTNANPVCREPGIAVDVGNIMVQKPQRSGVLRQPKRACLGEGIGRAARDNKVVQFDVGPVVVWLTFLGSASSTLTQATWLS